jgi:hypothetical protein
MVVEMIERVTDPVSEVIEDAGRAAGLLAHVSPIEIEAGYGKRPTPVSRWSDERRRAWLEEHADQLPPTEEAA